ncbi:MAG: hypothetical protein ACXAEF_00685 [Candidatus Thorarchaeota archaeon]|jgi:hypothetical protein
MAAPQEEIQSWFFTRIRVILISIASFIVLLLPYGYHIDLGPGPSGFWAILWERPEFTSGVQLLWFEAFEYFIYYLYRFVVLYTLWNFLKGEVQPKRLLRQSLICEIIPLLISIPGFLILDESGHNYIPIMIPIPILLLYCIILLLYIRYKTNP